MFVIASMWVFPTPGKGYHDYGGTEYIWVSEEGSFMYLFYAFASIFIFIDSNGNFICSLYESKYLSYHCCNLLTCVRASAWN